MMKKMSFPIVRKIRKIVKPVVVSFLKNLTLLQHPKFLLFQSDLKFRTIQNTPRPVLIGDKSEDFVVKCSVKILALFCEYR